MKEATLIIEHGRTMALRLLRLHPTEQLKGIEETRETLPALARDIPNISYLIAGESNGRARPSAKAAVLCVRDANLRAMAARLAADNQVSSASSS